MKKIIFEVTNEELDQLAVMAYLAQYVVDSSGKYSTGYKYPHMQDYLSMLRKINKEILLEMPKTEMVEADGSNEHIFSHTMKTEDTCQKLRDEFENSTYHDRICMEITRRDFIEQGGDRENSPSVYGDLFISLHDNNMKESKEYGLSRFKIIE
jgi:hypothetical protein